MAFIIPFKISEDNISWELQVFQTESYVNRFSMSAMFSTRREVSLTLLQKEEQENDFKV